MDNLSNSKLESIRRVRHLTGKPCPFEQVDLLDSNGLDAMFNEYEIEGVIHFAGLKAVGESVEKPMLYYRRSEERRVGKECRSGRWRAHEKRKKEEEDDMSQ